MTPDEAAHVLRVGRDASAAEIEQAYRRQARASHPDRSGGAADDFVRITRARDVLLAAPVAIELLPTVGYVVHTPRALVATWVGLIVVAAFLCIYGAPHPVTIAEPLVRWAALAAALVAYAVTGRRAWLVLSCILIAATAILVIAFTTLGGLVGLLLLIAPIYGLMLIGLRRRHATVDVERLA